MEQQIRFCTTADGVTIAYSVMGEGTPMLVVPGWISHLELDFATPGFAALIEGIVAPGRQIIRYDGRGTGLSDRDVTDVSIPARVRDMEAVVDHLGLTPFVLFGWSQGGPPAVIYAAEHAERLSRLILYGSFARPYARGREEVIRALLALMRAEWAVGSKTVVQFVNPDADKETADGAARYFRQAASVEVASAILEEGMFQADVTQYLPRLIMPTLVMHRREDNAVPFEFGRQLAALIPNARFVPLPGNAHPLSLGDQAPLLDAINDFLGERPAPAPQERHIAHGPSDLHIILFTDMEGSTTLTQRLGDARAQEILRTHNAIVRDALQAHEGSEVKHTGDGLMASFHAASRAIECAIAIQRAFAQRNASLPAHPEPVEAAHPEPVEGAERQPSAHPSRASGRADGSPRATPEPIYVRIGLNAGEPVAEEQDLFGTAVQMAARICARAEPGEILISNVVRELAAGKGFLFSDQGDVALRGFEDPVRLYEVRWEA